MNEEEILEKVNKILLEYKIDLIPELFPIKTVGVQGDNRTYAPILNLKGKFPGWEILGSISTIITNNTIVNKVTYEIIE